MTAFLEVVKQERLSPWWGGAQQPGVL